MKESPHRLATSTLEPARAVRAHPRGQQQKALRAFILVAGALIMLCFALADPILRSRRKADFKDAPPQTGTATVAMIVLPQPNFEGSLKQENAGFVDVRFQGRLYKVNTVRDITHLKMEQPARIRYRVGKSGAIVVDAAEPLQDANASFGE